jgi:hypothetical protein
MTPKDGRKISPPEAFSERFYFSVRSLNIKLIEYLPLLKHAFSAVGIKPRYFHDSHPYNKEYTAERYI